MEERSQTHWTRFLFRSHIDGEKPETKGSPIASALVLLAIYIAMYVAVGAVLQFLDPRSDQAFAPGTTTAALPSTGLRLWASAYVLP
jgi:hypothetical protein